MRPLSIPFSIQTNEPSLNESNNMSKTTNEFKLGNPYVPPHGSNLNAPGSNNPKHSYNQINILEDGIADLFRNISSEKISSITNNISKTHNDTLDASYNSQNMIPFLYPHSNS